ncbi:UDP-N-acetylglucosamine 1-carboxyvinyltransferase [Buchnera aphidicola (Neophyllaphis podocarpi)]|uniref:UDP-N-acetylglucosamine 1-carboxyvinyltransferase n=1 Tax=Buchnera aphidicola TaxID=9 RepID=UPI003464B14E
MNKIMINGPTRLNGDVNISGSKNASLPILFATLLTKEKIILNNVPNIKDIEITIKLLKHLGVKIKIYKSTYIIQSNKVRKYSIPNNLVISTRASIWALGAFLTRFKKIKLAFPGGCNIGLRPIDIHIEGLRKLGAIIKVKDGFIKAYVKKKLKGVCIIMKKISVGATINIMNAAILAEGTTIIKNAAKEPEIIDTANFLNMLGANIEGAGNYKITIKGVKSLKGGSYKIPPDRIETGTFLVAAAISKGKITCHNTKTNVLDSILSKLEESGAKIKIGINWISLDMKYQKPKSVNIVTAPYPGFPTDMQAQFTILNITSQGKGTIKETIFENRFMHIPEIIKMGAKVKVKKNNIICDGASNLLSSEITAKDLRSSASLILAGCIAQGKTIINNIYHIQRGYENILYKLKILGANIKIIK